MTLFAPFSSLSILPSGGLRVLLRGRSAEAVCDPLPSAPPPPVRPTGSPPAAPLRVRIRRLIRPCPSRSGFGVRGSDAPCGGVVGRPPAEAIPKPHPLATQTRKGVKSRAALNPSSQSGFPLDRRVNSAAGERGLRRSAARNHSAPVVTACSIDPSTRTGRTSSALRPRLRRRTPAAARPSAHAGTRAPSGVTSYRAC